MTFGERLRALRESQGITLAQLGRAVGVSEATIQRYECGEIQNPKQSRVTALAQALGVSEAALMGWDDDDLDADVRLLARDLQGLSPGKRQRAIAILRMIIDEPP